MGEILKLVDFLGVREIFYNAYLVPRIVIFDLIEQLSHQEHSTAVGLEQVLLNGWIRQRLIVETMAAVLDSQAEFLLSDEEADLEQHIIVALVAVLEGVREGLIEAEPYGICCSLVQIVQFQLLHNRID